MNETQGEQRAVLATTSPMKLLILALGGEGGGVLADMIVEAAIRDGYPVQSTSIPGVAQRTGATSYYIELFPVRSDTLGAATPVFCLTPLAGDLDVIVSSELLETGRAIERGLPDPRRTLLISSTSRQLTVGERMQMADGRVDSAPLLAAARRFARDALLFDMGAEAARCRTVISTVMFGAIIGSGRLPLARATCEAVIRAQGRAVDASLAGFAAGFERAAAAAAEAGNRSAGGVEPAAEDRSAASLPPPASLPAGDARRAVQTLDQLVSIADARMRDYQDEAYARSYRERIARIRDAERAARGDAGDPADDVARAAARWLALWMSYEDTFRVADLKARPERLARIRAEAGAAAHEPLRVREFLKPGVEEIAALLPPAHARRLLAWSERRGQRGDAKGIRLATTSIHGWLLLRALAALRPLRRRSFRFQEEQRAIEHWMDALLRVLRSAATGERALRDERVAIAAAIAELPRLLKGYGETWRRGRRSYEAIMRDLVDGNGANAGMPADCCTDPRARAEAIRGATRAALAEPEGRELARALGRPLPVREQTIRIVRRPR